MSATVRKSLTALTAKGHELVTQAGRLGVQIGLVFADVDSLIREHGEKGTGYPSIRLYLESEYPEHVKPVYGSSDAYRWLQAGRVASIVGDVGDASVDALVYLHRYCDEPQNLRKVWAKGKGRKAASPSRAALVAAAIGLGVDKAGTAGPAQGSAKAGNGARAKAAKAGTAKPAPKSAPAPTNEVPVREVPNVTGSATKAAGLRLRKVAASLTPGSESAFLVIAQAVAQACDDIGSGNVLAALHVLAEETKAAKPRRTRTNRKAAAAQ